MSAQHESLCPQHIAIIMDGNRRWAKEKGLPRYKGHQAGYEALRALGDACLERGIGVISVFAFSTENWKRTEEEVGFLMDLLEKGLREELAYFEGRGIRLRILGRREGLRPSVLSAIENAEQKTAHFTKTTLCICLNYGGHAEIVDACKAIVRSGIPAEEITEQTIQQYLYWPEMPAPELVIRTSGEERLSGFLLWQSAYSELYWCEKHWPDFNAEDLDKAIEAYASRNRRFGK